MARTVAELPPGARIADYIGLGVIAKTFPDSAIGAVLARTGKASVRHRDLPAQVVVHYVIAERVDAYLSMPCPTQSFCPVQNSQEHSFVTLPMRGCPGSAYRFAGWNT